MKCGQGLRRKVFCGGGEWFWVKFFFPCDFCYNWKVESIYLGTQRVSSGCACCCRCPGYFGPRLQSARVPSWLPAPSCPSGYETWGSWHNRSSLGWSVHKCGVFHMVAAGYRSAFDLPPCNFCRSTEEGNNSQRQNSFSVCHTVIKESLCIHKFQKQTEIYQRKTMCVYSTDFDEFAFNRSCLWGRRSLWTN